jgi:two-component system chemotaxis response regulator CheY
MRVLVVDDSAMDRHLLTTLLEDLGHIVETCESTSGVLDKLSQSTYNALFLDVVMPQQDGFKFLRELRANPKTAAQHVILYSSKKTPLEINYGLTRSGANNYLTKPATKDMLESALQKV